MGSTTTGVWQHQRHNTQHTQSQCGMNSWFVAESFQQCLSAGKLPFVKPSNRG